MNTRILIGLAIFAAACGTTADADKDVLTKSQAQMLVDSGDADEDICSENGFNDDDVCDDWCPDGDEADCSTSNTCEDGATKDADDGCNSCTCSDGFWACTEIACVEPNNDDGNNTASPDVLQIGDCPSGGDMLTVDAISITKDVLSVQASFGGGCAEHTVTACWDGSFLESFPVQAHISLYHDANGDTCEALLSQTFEFDLTPMRESYVEGYQTTEGTILLGVEEQGTEYTF